MYSIQISMNCTLWDPAMKSTVFCHVTSGTNKQLEGRTALLAFESNKGKFELHYYAKKNN